MKDMDKTKEELLAETVELRRRIETLEKAEADRRNTVEEALRESEVKYRQLLDVAPAAIYEVDMTTGKFLSVNDLTCETIGYTKEEFLNLTIWDFLKDESRGKILERIDKMLKGEPVSQLDECEVITKDGREISLLFNSRIEYENGKPVKTTTVAQDITEKKKLEQELLKAQKLESLGVLAGGFAHDFNNFLSGIMGNISLAKLEVGWMRHCELLQEQVR
jgi:PAS domain S-box-containing protein